MLATDAMVPRAGFTLLASLVGALTLAGCASDVSEDEGAASTEDELRRYEDASKERPEVGAIKTKSGTLCTGTLIGARTILTAAHCVDFASGIYAANAPAPGKFELYALDGKRRDYEFRRFRADAGYLEFGFDLAVLQLDKPVPKELATPAVIAERWPNESLTVYGFGLYGAGCKLGDNGTKRRKTTVAPKFPSWTITSCPGDSGGPFFRGTSNEIVAAVKGRSVGQWVADAVKHRDWILKHLEASERGELTID